MKKSKIIIFILIVCIMILSGCGKKSDPVPFTNKFYKIEFNALIIKV